MTRCLLLAVVITFFLGNITGKSDKKGVCIPPGEHFHCGDLAAFHNVRYDRNISRIFQEYLLYQLVVQLACKAKS